MEYIKSKKPDGCIFCKESLREDQFLLYEGKYCFVMMNKYPYNAGHIMILPLRHISDIESMFKEEKIEFMDLLDLSVRILKKAIEPEGFNIGINVGKAAGAGVEGHLHLHIVPRWLGDTNFMTVPGEVRVIPEDVAKTREKLLSFFRKQKEV